MVTKRTEWINNIETDFVRHEERPKMNIHVDALKSTRKNQTGEILGPNGIHGFWFKKFTTNHDRLATEMNKCTQKTDTPELMTKGMDTLIQKDPLKRIALKTTIDP